MNYICHRINKLEDLNNINTEYGVEIDLRDNVNGKIYIEHDPFKEGEDFEEYIKNYHHNTIILNIKSERIEYKVIEILNKYNITNYFFLDSSFPMIKALTDIGIKNIALRYSEFEGMDTLEFMKGKVDWVWVDCFNSFPLNNSTYKKLKSMGYKLCFVSPELQNQAEKIDYYIRIIKSERIDFDLICTKVYNINLWEEKLNINQ